MGLGLEERRVAVEAISSLVYIKNVMADLILKPAGVPPEVYRSLLYQRDETSGRALSKRQIAPLIIDAVEKREDCPGIVTNGVSLLHTNQHNSTCWPYCHGHTLPPSGSKA